jgi:hypothetical protein
MWLRRPAADLVSPGRQCRTPEHHGILSQGAREARQICLSPVVGGRKGSLSANRCSEHRDCSVDESRSQSSCPDRLEIPACEA